MQKSLELYRKLRNDIPTEEEAFPAIDDQIRTLDKYMVPISDEIRARVKGIKETWEKYLDVLDEAEKMINYTKVILREMGRITF